MPDRKKAAMIGGFRFWRLYYKCVPTIGTHSRENTMLGS